MNQKRLICCWNGAQGEPEARCGNDAEYEIVEERRDVVAGYDAYTHTCAEHLALLLGTTTGKGYDPAVRVTRWEVRELSKKEVERV